MRIFAVGIVELTKFFYTKKNTLFALILQIPTPFTINSIWQINISATETKLEKI